MNASAVKTLLENFLKIARALRRAQFKKIFAYRGLEGNLSAKQSRHSDKDYYHYDYDYHYYYT